MQSQYYVYRDHSLLYQQSHWPWRSFYGVLAGKVLRGGYNPKNGVVCINDQDLKDLRTATPADFDDFGICSAGFFPEAVSTVS